MLANQSELGPLMCNLTNSTPPSEHTGCWNHSEDATVEDFYPWVPFNEKTTAEGRTNARSTVVIVIGCSTTVLFLTALLLNSSVFMALTKVESKVLRSKFLIQNMLVVNIIMPLAYALRILPSVLLAFDKSGSTMSTAISWIEILLKYYNALTMYVQLISAFVLACDRLHAILSPMRYNMIGYPWKVKIFLLSTIWLLAVVLELPCFIIAFGQQDQPLEKKLQIGYNIWTKSFLWYFVIGACLSVFVLYISIFVLIRWKSKQSLALKQFNSETLKKSYSLTLTYFASHLCTLFLYLPAPFFYLLKPSISRVVSQINKSYIEKLVQNIYIFNPILDPIILYTRIRSVRQNLNFVLKGKPQSQTSSKHTGTQISHNST